MTNLVDVRCLKNVHYSKQKNVYMSESVRKIKRDRMNKNFKMYDFQLLIFMFNTQKKLKIIDQKRAGENFE